MRADAVRVPRDVSATINKKRAARIVIFCVIEIALILTAVFYGNDIGGNHPGFSYAIFGGLTVLPVFLLKMPFWLFDKTFSGEILSINEEIYNEFEKGMSKSMRMQVNKKQQFKIKLDNGKIMHYTVYDDQARHAFRKTTYNVGDRIIHVAGTKYLQAVAVNDEDTLICVVCGAESRATTLECPVCGKTLKIN